MIAFEGERAIDERNQRGRVAVAAAYAMAVPQTTPIAAVTSEILIEPQNALRSSPKISKNDSTEPSPVNAFLTIPYVGSSRKRSAVPVARTSAARKSRSR